MDGWMDLLDWNIFKRKTFFFADISIDQNLINKTACGLVIAMDWLVTMHYRKVTP